MSKMELRVCPLRLVLVAIATVCIILGSSSCSQYVSPKPNLHVSATTLSFGEVVPSTLCEGGFILQNTGSAPLEVRTTTKSCGCLKVDWQGNPSKIAPDASCTLRVQFRPKKLGEDGGFVTLSTNDANSPTITLNVKAIVSEETLVSPPALSLSNLHPDSDTAFPLFIKSRTDLGEIMLSSDKLRVVSSKTERIDDGYNLLLTFGVPPDLPVGGSGEIKLLTGSKTYPVLVVPYTYKLVPYIQCTPSTVFVSRDEAAKRNWVKEVTVISTDGQIFSIKGITPTSPGIEVSMVSEEAGNAVLIQFRAKNDVEIASQRIRCNILTTHPKQKSVECQVAILSV